MVTKIIIYINQSTTNAQTARTLTVRRAAAASSSCLSTVCLCSRHVLLLSSSGHAKPWNLGRHSWRCRNRLCSATAACPSLQLFDFLRRVAGVCETAEEKMSQIASKVCYEPQPPPVAPSPDVMERALGHAMPVEPPLAVQQRPSPMPGRQQVTPNHTARVADRLLAIEPLRAPGYAPPTTNAPRRELAESREAAAADLQKPALTRTFKATTWSSTLTGSPSPPSRSSTSLSSAPESATLALRLLPTVLPAPLLLLAETRPLVRWIPRWMCSEWCRWECREGKGREM
jgi:hypothetical protein